jgi:hypothetical protein
MEELREELMQLIEIKGISCDEVITLSCKLDEFIIKHYEEVNCLTRLSCF